MKEDYTKNALDIFRLIATLQVFLGHIITHFSMENPPVNVVYFVRGVPILFVLCGFLTAKSLEGRSVKKWLLGRLVRVVPAFWMCILVNTVIILIVYETKPSVIDGVIYLITQFLAMNFYTGDWLREYGCGVPNGVLWTIPVQIQFFLLAPIMAKIIKPRSVYVGGATIFVLSAFSILLQRISAFLPSMISKLIGVTVAPYLYFLVAGMVAWYHKDKIIPALQKRKWFILLSYFVWKLMENHLAFPHFVDGVLYNIVTTLLVAALIFAFAFCGTWRMKRDITYGFYLYHMVIVNLILHLGVTSLEPLWQGGVLVAGIALLTTICAWLSQHLIEIPTARLLKKRG